MTPFRHPTTNTTLEAPDDWDVEANGECIGLPITQSGSTMFSFWRPTWRERLRLLFGGHIRLGVVGRGHPPVSLDTL